MEARRPQSSLKVSIEDCRLSTIARKASSWQDIVDEQVVVNETLSISTSLVPMYLMIGWDLTKMTTGSQALLRIAVKLYSLKMLVFEKGTYQNQHCFQWEETPCDECKEYRHHDKPDMTARMAGNADEWFIKSTRCSKVITTILAFYECLPAANNKAAKLANHQVGLIIRDQIGELIHTGRTQTEVNCPHCQCPNGLMNPCGSEMFCGVCGDEFYVEFDTTKIRRRRKAPFISV